ncbi:MAG: thrombospondin type 3 repeat-containing protein [Patescibacteria group bacterium]
MPIPVETPSGASLTTPGATGRNATKYWVIGGVSLAVVILIAVGVWFLRSRDPFAESGIGPDRLQGPASFTEIREEGVEPNYEFPAEGSDQLPEDQEEILRREYEAFFGRPVESVPEVSTGTQGSPSEPSPPPPPTSPDPDNDGLTTIQEEQIGTDPNNPDTDGDGFNDGDEVQAGYNPLGPGRLQ